MESLLAIPLIGPFLGVILPFLLVLGVVIFVHEYGHYIVGRWCGIYAEIFSIGVGPEIVGWNDRRGTRWRICWVPLGGYVKFKGDSNAASASDAEELAGLSDAERRSTLGGAPLWARSATVAAGPFANFLLTILMIFAIGLAIGRPSNEPVIGEAKAGGQAYGGGIRTGDRIVSVDGAPIATYGAFTRAMLERPAEPKKLIVERTGPDGAAQKADVDLSFTQLTRIAQVTPGGPAALACVKAGDVIHKVDGQTVASFEEVQQAVQRSEGREMTLSIRRGQEPIFDAKLQPRVMEIPDPATGGVEKRLLIGVSADFNIGLQPTYEALGFGDAFLTALAAPWRIAKTTFGYLGAIFAGESDGSSLRGPLGIAEISGEAASQGLLTFLFLMASLSTAIGLMNLFPIPILDGGHLVFYAIEAVRGRPLAQRTMEAAMAAGFVAIIALLVFATSNDATRFFGAVASGC